MPASAILAPFQVDHIIARQHGGSSDLDNLAPCCIHCNRFKGPNIAGIDSNTGDVVRLFHPRQDVWDETYRGKDHFEVMHFNAESKASLDKYQARYRFIDSLSEPE